MAVANSLDKLYSLDQEDEFVVSYVYREGNAYADKLN